MTSIQTLQTDILVLGSGGTGLFAALHAHQANPDLHITIAVKGLLGKCGCTRMVQGGYNVALAEGDSVERHFMDTIEGGKWLSDQELAWTLVNKSVERIRELENELGCFFDRNPDGTIHQKAFAGQTFDRTVHKGDLTGIEIINRLAEQVWARGIHRLEEHRAIELIKSQDGKALAGVLMLNMRTGEFVMVRAKAVLLGTGGGPTMYKYHTPSGDKSCDGLAMALRAGLTLRDMEMVQFHPTGMLAGPDTRMTGTVLEEGLRGAGGYLLNGNKERFMGHYDPRNERATRDIVSRSIIYEMRAGRVTPNGGVYIQMHHLGPDNVRKLFKGMVERCADSGFDLANDLVGKKVAILGAAFKPDSDDVRDSPALDIAAQIQAAGAIVTVHDPKAIVNAQKRFPALNFAEEINETLKDSNIVLHLTEWKIYREIDPSKVKAMVKDAIMIDGRNALDRELWLSAGWKFRALGRSQIG